MNSGRISRHINCLLGMVAFALCGHWACSQAAEKEVNPVDEDACLYHQVAPVPLTNADLQVLTSAADVLIKDMFDYSLPGLVRLGAPQSAERNAPPQMEDPKVKCGKHPFFGASLALLVQKPIRSCCLVQAPHECWYEIGYKKSFVRVEKLSEYAAALKPIDSAGKALALVALGHKIPIADEDRYSRLDPASFHGWELYRKNAKAFEIEERQWGYVVRVPLPVGGGLGCSYSQLLRVPFKVTRDGQICLIRERPIILATSKGEMCMD